MPKSRKTTIALDWLTTGQSPTERGTEVVTCLVLLAHDLPLSDRLPALAGVQLGADIEMAMLVLAERANALELLVHLRDNAAHKSTAKQAKKFLFRAKQRGADIPLDATPAKAVRLARKPDPLPSYCSTFDREGGQVVVLGGWAEEHGAWALVGIVQAEQGLNTVAWLPKMSRSRLKTVLDGLAGQRSEQLVEVAADFAAGRLKWALCEAESMSRRVEGDRSKMRRLLADIEPLHRFVAGEARPEALSASEQLLSDPCFEGWLSGVSPALEDGLLKLEMAGETEAQSAESQAVALSVHLDDWFGAARRNDLAHRLQIVAMLLGRLGRNGASQQACAVAHALADEGVQVSTIPVMRALVARHLVAKSHAVQPEAIASP
ncbi:MAG: hypothetical protein KC502_05165 [Myxococcales bacterium]|nr:hypothetical protein [Myxococcales bacterium]